MTSSSVADPALQAYEALAPHYDQFTADYQHERWLEALEALALQHDLPGRRLLDVACGTGKSFMPLLRAGYRTSACDLSPRMVDIARARSAGRAHVFVADMRSLEVGDTFDLITCLDDALNYLTDDEQLVAAITGMGARLAPGGLLVFDLTTLAGYRNAFSTTFDRRSGDFAFRWKGQTRQPLSRGLMSATIEIRDRHGEVLGTSHHVQRHHPLSLIPSVLAAAGLELCACAGQQTGATLESLACETRHPKIVWVARRPSDPS